MTRATIEGDNEQRGVLEVSRGSDADSSTASVLVLSVVHPDYLPSLYALSDVLDRHGYAAHVFTFESPAAPSAAWQHANLHLCGEQRGGPLARWQARRSLIRTASSWSRRHAPVALIATCPFTLVSTSRMSRREVPLVYFCYEANEVRLTDAPRSPLSWWRSRAAFRLVRKADLVCVPSAERAGWLLARARLERAPEIVLNSPARPFRQAPDAGQPSSIIGEAGNRAIVVHTGRVSHAQGILELIESVQHWPEHAMLVVTNVGSSDYEHAVRDAANRSLRAHDIVLLPAIGRSDMLLLQQSASVGVVLTRETSALETVMPAPNKVGEYLHAGLLTVGSRSGYLEVLERHSVAVLADSLSPHAIAQAIGTALERVKRSDQRARILAVANEWYNMDVQARPLLRLLDAARNAGS